jgi:hypothetical protein
MRHAEGTIEPLDGIRSGLIMPLRPPVRPLLNARINNYRLRLLAGLGVQAVQ